MNKKILLASLFVLIVALSVGSIYASDVNVTDSCAISPDTSAQQISVDESQAISLESNVDNDASEDVLQSNASSTLSTNMENSNVLTSDSNSSSTAIDVSKTITSNDVTKYYKGSAKYTATFLDLNGTALANTNVKVNVNGVVYTKTTDNNGAVSLDVNLKPGTYKVTATNPVTGYSLTTTFTILSTITASNVNKVYLDGKKFTAKFYKSNGKALAKKKIKIKFRGRTYKVKTNKNGIAKLSLKYVPKGKYNIKMYNKDGLTVTKKVKVVKSSKTSLSTNDYAFLKSDTKKIKVKVLDRYNYAVSKGKFVKFKVNGKSYYGKTNKKGIAKVKLPKLKAGTYKIKYKFIKSGYYKSSSAKSKLYVYPSKNPKYTVKSTTTFGHGANTLFKVALTSGSVPIVGKTVSLSVNGQTYAKTTDRSGIVSLPISLDIGDYVLSYSNGADSKINAKSGSTPIKVIERTNSTLTWKSATTFYQGSHTTDILLLDVNGKPISGGLVKLTVNSRTYAVTTSSSGYAKFTADYPDGNYSVSYNFIGDNLNAPTSGSTSLVVKKITSVPIKDIALTASALKSYIESSNNLPPTVVSGGVTFTIPEFLYLMAKGISQLGNSNTNNVPIIRGVAQPTSPSGDVIDSQNLYMDKYLVVTNNLASYIETNKRAPNYGSSAVGNIIYSELVDATSRILAFYANNNRLPNYCVISYGSGGGGSSQSGTGLNEINTITNLAPYLVATKNCQVNDQSIKDATAAVIKDCTSDYQKANKIFEYVKKVLSYSFYSNTKFGAVDTLKYGYGNCVDHSHLLVAMFRAAKLPARYAHGSCTFSSGHVYGHVWAQVLVGNKWYMADATSSKNSLGSVANWNTKSFTLKGIYISLSF